MGFSCTIKQGGKDLTKSLSHEDGVISYKLFGLAPSHPEDTVAPYDLSQFRNVVSEATYADGFPMAAQDCFRALQSMAKANLESLKQQHCSTCTCEPLKPKGWNIEDINKLLSIDAGTITSISGGY